MSEEGKVKLIPWDDVWKELTKDWTEEDHQHSHWYGRQIHRQCDKTRRQTMFSLYKWGVLISWTSRFNWYNHCLSPVEKDPYAILTDEQYEAYIEEDVWPDCWCRQRAMEDMEWWWFGFSHYPLDGVMTFWVCGLQTTWCLPKWLRPKRKHDYLNTRRS